MVSPESIKSPLAAFYALGASQLFISANHSLNRGLTQGYAMLWLLRTDHVMRMLQSGWLAHDTEAKAHAH